MKDSIQIVTFPSLKSINRPGSRLYHKYMEIPPKHLNLYSWPLKVG